MRIPDRPWAETNAGGIDRSGRLADRLTRLPAGHPSADLTADPEWYPEYPDATDPGDAGFEDVDPAAPDPDRAGPDDLAPDEIESGPVDPGDGGDGAPTDTLRPRRSAGPTTWDAAQGMEGDPYRPWFSADGASDPWFSEPIEWTSP
jgi:hypothetical protein